MNYKAKVLSGEAGQPGKQWTAQEVKVIRLKLKKIWDNAIEITKQFDPDVLKLWPSKLKEDMKAYEYDYNLTNQEDVEYLYDPEHEMSIPDCDGTKGFEDKLCKKFWAKKRREEDIAFNERKTLRLAFHDCVPYEDGTGGCDGCLNFDDNLEENNGLQFTAAVLEKLYTDVEFPRRPFEDEAKLDASPKELGISRADLWAFAGLVALDEIQQKTKAFCELDKLKTDLNYTCGLTQCYSPFDTSKFQSMFQTGRTDCVPKAGANQKHQYLSGQKEVHPNQHGNGQDSVDYFQKHFNLDAREGLALLGIHTVGQFNPMAVHLSYSWSRDRDNRNELFNNDYYQLLSEKPYYVGHDCIGKFGSNKPADSRFKISARVFPLTWKNREAEDYTDPGNRGFLTWKMEFNRGVDCKIRNNNNEDKNTLFKDEWDTCCKDKKDKIVSKDPKIIIEYPKNCTKFVNGRIRFTSSEIGYYYDFHFNQNGMPQGCSNFENFTDAMPKGDTKKLELILKDRHLGGNSCPKQKKLKHKGKPMSKIVDFFAEKDNLAVWHNEFLDSYKKMASNKNQNLETSNREFMSHTCEL